MIWPLIKISNVAAVLLFLAAAILAWRRKNQGAMLLVWLGLGVQTLFLLFRLLALGGINYLGLDTMFFLPWALAVITIICGWRQDNRDAAAWLAIITGIFALLTLPFPKAIIPPNPKSATIFTFLFFIGDSLAQAAFYGAGWLMIVAKKREAWLKIAHQLALWGFIVYSIAQVTGNIWCYLGWAVPFHWSMRHLQSTAIWLWYANYLHLKYMGDWSTDKKALFLFFGALLILLTSIGVQHTELLAFRVGE